MPYKEWLRPPRHLLLLFLTITFVLAAAWGWSGFRLLEQERALGNQRLQERLDRAADLIVAALLQALSNPEEQIAALPALPEAQRAGAQARFAKEVGDDVLVTVFDPQRVAAYPPSRLLYYPVVPESKGPPRRRVRSRRDAGIPAEGFFQSDRGLSPAHEFARFGDAGRGAPAFGP